MGQTNLKRTQFIARAEALNPGDNTTHQVNELTCFFEVGDEVLVKDIDGLGNEISILGGSTPRTVLSIDPGVSVTLSGASIDTSTATDTPVLENQTIDDGQEAVKRAMCKRAEDVGFLLRQDILAQELNAPSPGKTTYDIADASFWRAGDTVDILADEGLIQAGAIIESVDVNADDTNNYATIVITSVVDTSSFTNPYLLNTTITANKAILRNQEKLDGIDAPIENEDLGLGDAETVVFRTANLFVQNSSKLLLDGRRLKKGTAGTRASLTQGSGDSQLIFTSLVLGTSGDDNTIEVQNGAGLSITVTGNFQLGHSVVINDNGGAATAQDIADALNADATVRELFQTQYGGTGAGLVSAFGPTSIGATTPGLNDGTGDYAELQQVYENNILSTGFNILSLWILPSQKNRLKDPPEDDEELVVDYRKASDNVDR